LESLVSNAELQIYSPMFSEVRTNEEGYFVLPIIEDAFEGKKTVVKLSYAVGTYQPTLDGQNRYQLNFRELDKIDDLETGKKIVLPANAANAAPKSLIGLIAKSADGDRCFAYVEQEITPPNLELIGNISVRDLEYNQFIYELNVRLKMGNKIQQGKIGVGNAKASLKIGKQPDSDDWQNIEVNLTGYDYNNGYAQNQYFLPDSIGAYDKVYLTALGETVYGKKSPDSTVIALAIPWPEKFCEKPKLSINHDLMINAIRHGFGNKQDIAGYKIALGSDENFTIRPYPDQVDIATADWQPGKTITTPLKISDNTVSHVGIKAISKSGTEKENRLELQLFPKAVVQVVPGTMLFGTEIKLDISGQLEAGLLASIQPNRYIHFGLFKDGQEVDGGSTTASSSGVISETERLGNDVEFGQQYTFKTWYWLTSAQQHVVWDTIVRMPSKPLFNRLEVNEDDKLVLTISEIGFNGNASIIGYQYAIGTAEEHEANRSFPSFGTIDFSPDEVQVGTQLKLPGTIFGLPLNCFVSLRAVSNTGEVHETIQSIKLRPPIPQVVSLEMDNHRNFTAIFTNTSFDNKCQLLDFWIREAPEVPNGTIAFKELRSSAVDWRSVKFNSRFEPADTGKTYIYEGLNIGYEINSPNFQYRFIIEKSGSDYRIVPQ